MRLRIAPRLDELAQIRFARLECRIGQLAAKQLVPQPNAIGIDDIALTVVGDVLNSPFPKIFLDFATIDVVGLAWQSPSRDTARAALTFAGDVNEDKTSHRSIASSVYRLK